MNKTVNCSKCGTFSDYKADDGGCGTCAFWAEKFEALPNKPEYCFVKMGYGECNYQILFFNPINLHERSSFLGFGGRWWMGRNTDGTFRVSNNCWSAGYVPSELEHLIPSDRIIKTFNFRAGLQTKWWNEVSGRVSSNLSIPESVMMRLPQIIAELYEKRSEQPSISSPFLLQNEDPIAKWEDFLCKSK
ncbi:hypothetical protein MYOV002v2_p0138 [Vibrio phage 144E46.1]|nr:hypothetical protein MYOV002v2_p0138 [Vibrio phage 144E46.1]